MVNMEDKKIDGDVLTSDERRLVENWRRTLTIQGKIAGVQELFDVVERLAPKPIPSITGREMLIAMLTDTTLRFRPVNDAGTVFFTIDDLNDVSIGEIISNSFVPVP